MSDRAARLLLPIIYLGFISLGLPDGTLGVAWPRMHQSLDLPIGWAGPVMAVITLLSGISSFSSGAIIARFKTGPVVLASCLMTGSALMLVAHAQSLAWLALAAAPLGFGAGAVDAGLNGYVARHYSGRHMNWLHACWGIGATCGPFILARSLDLAPGWRGGYFVIASIQLTLALVFLVTLRMWDAVPLRPFGHATPSGGPAPTHGANSEAGWISAALFAIYVAVEMTIGLWAGSILAVGRGIPVVQAGLCATGYYASITAGRILVGFVVDRWGNRRLVAAGVVLSLAGAVAFALADHVGLAAAALVLIGLGFAPVYPGLMHEVPRRFVPSAVQTVIGRQSGAAYLGAMTLPALGGWIAQRASLEAIVWVVAAGIVAMLVGVRRLDRIS
ncbi:MAG: MFS transporter [Opitutaceae bacterium]|nr:MFS transporter [Opitutaceae bacterium]